MKRLLALLLLSACNADPEPASPEADEEAAVRAAAAAAMPDALAERDLLQSQAAAAVAPLLSDASSAQYIGLWRGNEGAICGGVDSKLPGGSRSGTLPFVVPPAGGAMVSKGQELRFDDPKDKFLTLYLRWCASPEEASLLTGQEEPADTPLPPDERLLPPAENESDTLVPPPPVETAPPVPVPSRRGGDGDSFSDAVLRPVPPEKK
jgi:hypothetical protein